MELDIGAALSRAWRTWCADPWPFVGATAFGCLVLLVLFSPLALLIALDATGLSRPALPPWAVIAVFGLTGMFAAVWLARLWLGVLSMSLAALRGGKPRLSHLGLGLRPFVSGFLAWSLADMLARLGTLACVVPGVVLYCRYALAAIFVVDKRLGPLAAMAASERVTFGSRWAVLGLTILSPCIWLGGLALAGLGILVAYPLTVLAWAAAYEQLCRRAGPVRLLPSDRSRPRPDDVALCPACLAPRERGEVATCLDCEAVYHRACAGRRCVVAGCAMGRPAHPDWTREARAQGPWIEVEARPVPAVLHWAGLAALFPAVLLSDLDSVRGLIQALERAIPAADRWMTLSAGVSITLVPWAAILALAVHEHRAYRSALFDRWGVLLDWGPDWPGRRIDWRDLGGFSLEPDGVQLVARQGRIARLLAPTLAVAEADRPVVAELLEAHGVRRMDA